MTASGRRLARPSGNGWPGGSAQLRSSSESGLSGTGNHLDRTTFSDGILRDLSGKVTMNDRKVCIADLLNCRMHPRARSSDRHQNGSTNDDIVGIGASASLASSATILPAPMQLQLPPAPSSAPGSLGGHSTPPQMLLQPKRPAPPPPPSIMPDLKTRGPQSIMARRTFSLLHQDPQQQQHQQQHQQQQQPNGQKAAMRALQQPIAQRQALKSPNGGSSLPGSPDSSPPMPSLPPRLSGASGPKPPLLPRNSKAWIPDSCTDSAPSSARRSELGTPKGASSPGSFVSGGFSRTSSRQSLADDFHLGLYHDGRPRSILRRPSFASGSSEDTAMPIGSSVGRISKFGGSPKKVSFAKDVKAAPPSSISDLLRLVRHTADDRPPTPPPVKYEDQAVLADGAWS